MNTLTKYMDYIYTQDTIYFRCTFSYVLSSNTSHIFI